MDTRIKSIILFAVVISINIIDLTFAQWVKIKSPEIKIPISTYAAVAKGDTILIGTYRSTIYRSTNDGLDWAKSDSGTSNLYWTYDFSLQGNYVFAVGENGILRSSDMGETWQVKNKGLYIANWMNVYSLVQSNNLLFAATDFGVYESSDNGDNWHPSNGDSSYNTIYSLTLIDSTLFAGSMANGVLRSTDKGVTWNKVNNGLPYLQPNNFIRINKLYADGKNLYAGTNQWGIYYSTNKGDTWLPDTGGLQSDNNGYYSPIYSISRSGSYLYAGSQGGGIYRQTSAGNPWTQVNMGLQQNPFVISIISSEDKIFAATFNGLYYTKIDSADWLPIFTEYPGNIYINALGSARNDLFINASSDYYNGTINEFFYSPDMGNTWTPDTNLSKNYINSIKSFGDSSYAFGNGLFFSSNNNINWIEIDSAYINDIIKDNDTIYTCYGFNNWQWGQFGNIYLSANNGKTWENIWKGDTATFAIAKIGNYLFMGSRGVLRSTNMGASWSAINNGLPSNVEIVSFNKIGQFLFANSKYHIYLSTDQGNYWTSADNGLPLDTLVNSSINLLTNYNYLFAPTYNGVYVSADFGKSWTNISNGLNGNALSTISLTMLGSSLILSTNDGLWQLPISNINIIQNHDSTLPQSYYLSQNYPNPFNPGTTINYSVPNTSLVTIKIYDILGRAVATLVNENKSAGNYSVQFNASSKFPSGVYFYRMQAGSFVQTKKLILMK